MTDTPADPREAVSGDLSGPHGPAERLRLAAAALLRDAAGAPPDTWRLTHVRAALVPWVARMSPDLAEPLAALLRDAAYLAAQVPPRDAAEVWDHDGRGRRDPRRRPGCGVRRRCHRLAEAWILRGRR